MSALLPDGIFAVCALAGAPVSAAEAIPFQTGQGVVDKHGQIGEALLLMVVDHTPDRGDTGCFTDRGQTLAFLGDLDDRAALAVALSLPPQTPASQLALYAFRRWGDAAPGHLEGLWTLLLWEKSPRCLTLACSRQLRDQLYVARVGDRVAISSSLLQLSRLPWLDKRFDSLGLLLAMGRAPLRAQLGEDSLLKDAKCLLPGTLCRFWSGRQTSITWAASLEGKPWSGDILDAVCELESLARRAVRRSLRRHRTIAITLSGGLDSSTLAWLAVSEKRSNQKVMAIASAARPQSGVPDERKWIELVAARLGIDVHYAVPNETTDIYVPDDHWFAWMEKPVATHGHYVYQNMFHIARQAGADAVLQGVYGEYSLTRTGALPPGEISLYVRLRRLLGQLRRKTSRLGHDDITDLFHVKLTHQARDQLPASLARFVKGESPLYAGPSEGPMGLVPGYEKSFLAPESSPVFGIRNISPFRDASLLALGASLPSAFTRDGPYSRALVRHMIKPHLPQEITLRMCKRPFSPEHDHLQRHQAEKHRQSIKAMSENCDWVDLGWLDQSLSQISKGKNDFMTGRVAQITSCALAFFAWWDRA